MRNLTKLHISEQKLDKPKSISNVEATMNITGPASIGTHQVAHLVLEASADRIGCMHELLSNYVSARRLHVMCESCADDVTIEHILHLPSLYSLQLRYGVNNMGSDLNNVPCDLKMLQIGNADASDILSLPVSQLERLGIVGNESELHVFQTPVSMRNFEHISNEHEAQLLSLVQHLNSFYITHHPKALPALHAMRQVDHNHNQQPIPGNLETVAHFAGV